MKKRYLWGFTGLLLCGIVGLAEAHDGYRKHSPNRLLIPPQTYVTTAAHAIRHTPPCCCRPAHGNGSWGIFRTILMPPSNSTPRTRSRSARGFKAMPQTREPPGAEAKLPKNFMATRPSESRKAVGSYTSMMMFHKVPLPRLKD